MSKRLPFTIGAILLLVLGIILTMPVAHGQDYYDSSEPYPYFRRASSSSSVSSSVPSYVAPVTTSASVSSRATVGLSIDADRSEANPGDEVRYWIHARNLWDRNLQEWKVAFFFDPNQMKILETGGGRLEGDHVTFVVPAMGSNQEKSFSVRVHLYKNLQPGMSLRTYGSMIWDGTISPACSHNDLQIMGPVRLIQTGAGDGTSPVENLQAFLRPISAASNGSPMPLIVWMGVLALGVGIGGGVGKKFLI